MSVLERLRMNFVLLQRRRRNGDRGAAMVEYALLLSGIAIVVGFSVALFGARLLAIYDTF